MKARTSSSARSYSTACPAAISSAMDSTVRVPSHSDQTCAAVELSTKARSPP
jgi:hypothetical protein